MAKIYDHAYFNHKVGPVSDANLSIASSAVLYGLSVYTVFYVNPTDEGFRAFRLQQHFDRLQNSAKIIGLEFPKELHFKAFKEAVKALLKANDPKEPVFVRATVHADGLVPGTRTRGVSTQLSMFIYAASPIVKPSG